MYICDKCGLEVKRGIDNFLKHQFEECRAHYIRETGAAGITVKVMPYVNLIEVENKFGYLGNI